jgi:cytochrome c
MSISQASKRNIVKRTRSMKIRAISKVAGIAVIGVVSVGLSAMVVAAADTTPAASTTMPKGEALAKGSDCFSCHAIDQKVVGPAFNAVAAKFAGQPGAESTLSDAITKGHVGTWGSVPMPAHPQLSAADTKEIVSWILTLKKAAATGDSSGKKYTYTVNGKTVSTDFPIYQPGTQTVTASVFTGYEQYNSYCFRCHGADAVGGSYAPNLRRSINNGMNESSFLSVAMTGRKAKGMPSWAGFFTPAQIDSIYQYVDARAVGVVSEGVPKH